MTEGVDVEKSEYFCTACLGESRTHSSNAETALIDKQYADKSIAAAVASAEAQMAQAAATQALVHTNQLLLDQVRQLTRYVRTIAGPAADLTSPRQ